MPPSSGMLDGPCDGTAETILVRRLEESLSRISRRALIGELEQLELERASARGIRRRRWLRLQAIRYVIRARDLRHELANLARR